MNTKKGMPDWSVKGFYPKITVKKEQLEMAAKSNNHLQELIEKQVSQVALDSFAEIICPELFNMLREYCKTFGFAANYSSSHIKSKTPYSQQLVTPPVSRKNKDYYSCSKCNRILHKNAMITMVTGRDNGHNKHCILCSKEIRAAKNASYNRINNSVGYETRFLFKDSPPPEEGELLFITEVSCKENSNVKRYGSRYPSKDRSDMEVIHGHLEGFYSAKGAAIVIKVNVEIENVGLLVDAIMLDHMDADELRLLLEHGWTTDGRYLQKR